MTKPMTPAQEKALKEGQFDYEFCGHQVKHEKALDGVDLGSGLTLGSNLSHHRIEFERENLAWINALGLTAQQRADLLKEKLIRIAFALNRLLGLKVVEQSSDDPWLDEPPDEEFIKAANDCKGTIPW